MPLKSTYFTPYTTKDVKPSGCLLRQLRIQAQGLSGNLDKIWPDIRDSKWIGGDKDGWERVPYWLDGFIPLSYLLDDKDMQGRAKKYVDAILKNQEPDGWICPCEKSARGSYDVWALFLLLKVLVVYFDCTGDERIEEAVYRALKNFRQHINGKTLFDWASARWYECLIPIYWIYERRPEPWLIELCHLLALEGIDYAKLFSTLPMDTPAEHPHWSYQTHVVNIAMALKADALYARVSGREPQEGPLKILQVLDQKHGTAVGHFTGDECLAGYSPTQGTELCGVVEAMYSYEQLLAVTGNPYWGDRLERLTYNALPGTTSADLWTHQYDQMTNQIACRRIPENKVHFTSNSGESHLFGLEPNFGCCTANFNQGWPKFALSIFMKSAHGIAVTALAPARLHTEVQGTGVAVEIITDYPFRDGGRIVIRTEKPVAFPLSIRIPGFAEKAAVNGEEAQPGSFFTAEKTWEGESCLEISFVFAEKFQPRPTGLWSVERGPLVFALPLRADYRPLEYVRDGVERKAPYCDYELSSDSPWNYGFLGALSPAEFHPIPDLPFATDAPPVTLTTQLAEIPWEERYGVCAQAPGSLEPQGAPQTKTLVPYGCTDLRMTEMPKL